MKGKRQVRLQEQAILEQNSHFTLSQQLHKLKFAGTRLPKRSVVNCRVSTMGEAEKIPETSAECSPEAVPGPCWREGRAGAWLLRAAAEGKAPVLALSAPHSKRIGGPRTQTSVSTGRWLSGIQFIHGAPQSFHQDIPRLLQSESGALFHLAVKHPSLKWAGEQGD